VENLPVHLHSGVSQRGMTFTVEDVASGKIILRMTLDPAAVFRMISGSNTMDQLNAELLPADSYAYVGRECHTFTRMFKLDTLNLYQGTKRIDPGDVPALAEFAEQVKDRCWAHTTGWSTHNERRVSFTMRRYDNDLTAEKAAEIQYYLDNAEPPKGLVSR
jgi:hypothetical protein